MKIAILSPLYPPDIAELASYTKELARRLESNHELTILTYGCLPEPIEGVRIVAIDKREPLFVRLPRYFFALWKIARSVDLIYAQNGASIELPLILVSLFSSTPYILRMGDGAALSRSEKRPTLHVIDKIAMKHAQSVVRTGPLPRPEILPFAKQPVDLSAYERSWTEHLTLLKKLFTNDSH